ncbi:protein TonB [Novosphingobium chloroacetimidivorans]|uniref:Protein TonB n=1 Tax=Novosphingobium chloroacetimidivorans TaxID=1428314 RepID=A0A7W7NW18_9SPHN|nr:energy transducer TonB [Novosphingobium chloroacetimidivorans]MBB4857690.1 protein TonB [Novosphingobium chloroacetimidivorans]
MATLASARLIPQAAPSPRVRGEVVSLADVREAVAVAPVYERAVYQPSRRSGPIAFVASAGVLLAVGAALATLNIVGQHKEAAHLTVVSIKELDTTPPPPPPAQKLEEPVAQPEQAFVPQPRIQLPSPGPTQVALDLPPPAQPPTTVAPVIAAPTAPAAAPAAPAPSAPVEGGDLSSQLLSGKPPVYPIDARRQKIQGTVKLRILVGPDGRVRDLQVAVSSGSDLLDRAALSAVKRWRYAPQQQNGVPVSVRGIASVTFGLA